MRDIVRIYGLITMNSVLQGSIKPISGTRGGDKKKRKDYKSLLLMNMDEKVLNKILEN